MADRMTIGLVVIILALIAAYVGLSIADADTGPIPEALIFALGGGVGVATQRKGVDSGEPPNVGP